MNNYTMYQVDAFSDRVFGGNPAAVLLLEEELTADLMLSIAKENNLSETAFAIANADGSYQLRWFTPGGEVDLCGHATLATAHILYTEYEAPKVMQFHTRSGLLTVEKGENGYWMDFPTDDIKPADDPAVAELFDGKPVAIFEGRDDYLVELETAEDVSTIQLDMRKVASLEKRGLIVTAQGKDDDFVSRCFYPRYGIEEDPVTGSAHTTLTPYWTVKLKKNVLSARQISARGGDVKCVFKGKRTSLGGNAVTYMKAIIKVD